MAHRTDTQVQGEGGYEAAERCMRGKRDVVKSGKVVDAAGKASQQSLSEGEQARGNPRGQDPLETGGLAEAS